MKEHSPNPFRLSVTGIDGAGKNSVTKAVLERASSQLDIIKLNRPCYEIQDGTSREIYPQVTHTIDTLHALGDRYKSRAVVLGASAISVLLQSRVLEHLAARRNPTPDIIATSRDARLDGAIYSGYYGGQTADTIPLEKRVNKFQKLTGIHRDLIITLTIDPEVAVQRIEQRINEERADGKSSEQQMHENIDDLARIAACYAPASRYLQQIQPHQSVTIDTTERSFDEVVDLTFDVLKYARTGHLERGEIISI